MPVQKKYSNIYIFNQQKFVTKAKSTKEQKGNIKVLIDPENECEIDEYINDDDLIDSYIIPSQTESSNEIPDNINTQNVITSKAQPIRTNINSNKILQNLFNQLLILYK